MIINPYSRNLDELLKLKATLRFLFFPEPEIREPNMLALLYTLKLHAKENDLHILPILDEPETLTYPDDLFIVKEPVVLTLGNNNTDEEMCEVVQLIEKLKDRALDIHDKVPLLIKLDILADDSRAVSMIYLSNVWLVLQKMWHESLLTTAWVNVFNIIAPCCAIYLRMVYQIPEFRYCISKNIGFHVIVTRSLLLNHIDETFRRNAIAILFATLFDGFIKDENDTVTITNLPITLDSICIPVATEIIGSDKLLSDYSALEKLFLKHCKMQKTENSVCGLGSEFNNKTELILRHFRLSFTTLWFKQFKNIPRLIGDNSFSAPINYSIAEDEFKNGFRYSDFNIDLHLKQTDKHFVTTSLPEDYIKFFTGSIDIYTPRNTLISIMQRIQILLNLPIDKNDCCTELLWQVYEPQLEVRVWDNGLLLFTNVVELLGVILKRDCDKVTPLILRRVEQKKKLLQTILSKSNNPISFHKCLKFFNTAARLGFRKVQQSNAKMNEALYLRICKMIMEIPDDYGRG